jgi:Holliday junction resolvase
MRRFGKKDDNHREIVKTLQRVGFACIDLSQLGDDIPDLCIARNGKTALVEIKTIKGKLTKGQELFLALWPGKAFVAHSAEEVLGKWEK